MTPATASQFIALSARFGAQSDALQALDEADRERLEALAHLEIYAELVRANVVGALLSQLPRTAALLGPERLHADVVAFLASAQFPSTHYLRDVSPAFIEFVTPRWQEVGLAAWLTDLARYEVESFVVAADEDEIPTYADELSLSQRVVFAPGTRLVRYQYAIHEYAEELQEAPAHRSTALLFYRDDAFDIHRLELSSLAATIVEQLLAKQALREAIAIACKKIGAGFDGAELASFLADLSNRGILLGRESA